MIRLLDSLLPPMIPYGAPEGWESAVWWFVVEVRRFVEEDEWVDEVSVVEVESGGDPNVDAGGETGTSELDL